MADGERITMEGEVGVVRTGDYVGQGEISIRAGSTEQERIAELEAEVAALKEERLALLRALNDAQR